MLFLLSPAKTLAESGQAKSSELLKQASAPPFAEKTSYLVSALQSLSKAELKSKVSNPPVPFSCGAPTISNSTY